MIGPTSVVVLVELVVVEVVAVVVEVVEAVVVVVGGRVVVVVVVDVEGVVLASKQVPLVLGFCCLQSFVRLRQVFRCAACVFPQPFFSAFVPVQSLFGGTSARQLLMSCLQSLRQWLAFAAAPLASIRTAPTIASRRARCLCTSRALLPSDEALALSCTGRPRPP